MSKSETVSETVETVAGKLVGEGDNYVVRYDKESKKVVAKLRIMGRWIYIRKCRRGDSNELIALADKTQDDTNICVVLAKGEKCGKLDTDWKRRAKEEKHKMGNVAQLNFDEVDIMDQVILPADHTFGIKRSPYHESEFFVFETVVEANLKR